MNANKVNPEFFEKFTSISLLGEQSQHLAVIGPP